MSTQNITGSSSLRERWSDPVISILTVVLILMLFVFAPLQALGIAAFQVLGFVSALVLIGGVFFVSASHVVAAAMLTALAMAIWAAFARLTAPSSFDVYLIAGAWLTMGVVLIFVVGRTVFAPGRVNYHRIVGAILVYLSIAVTFVALFTFVGLLTLLLVRSLKDPWSKPQRRFSQNQIPRDRSREHDGTQSLSASSNAEDADMRLDRLPYHNRLIRGPAKVGSWHLTDLATAPGSCPLSEVKQTSGRAVTKSANDPSRTLGRSVWGQLFALSRSPPVAKC